MKKFFALFLVVALLAITATTAFAGSGTGFDQYGYNDNGNIFNGTGLSWCMAAGKSADYCELSMFPYANDQLVMKWNEAWDTCNANGYNNPTYCAGAWTSNEWNGAVPGGSGEVWHYKIIWVGSAGTASSYWRPGGYSVWGNYEVVMDQGMSDGAHSWLAHATPNGYGN